jgi:PKD repeat protein
VCHLSSAQHDIHGACRGSWWIHRAINLGNVTAWHWWQYYFPHEDTADQGLVDLVGRSGYTIYPRYYMFKQWARNVRPGAVRVNTTSDNADLHVTAFKEGNTCYIVATSYRYNNPNTSVPATVDVTFNCPSITGAVGHIRTSATENYATKSNLTPWSNSFTVSIPGNTINTFIVPTASSASTASFTGNPTNGSAPLTVNFTDTSTGSPTSWEWDFSNDGITDSTVQNPQYTFNSHGTYTVKLIATNAQGSDSEVKTSYITVTRPLPPELQIPSQTGSSIQEQGCRLRLTGTRNAFYVTEHSPDLEHWQPLSTNQFLGLPIELLDSGATNAPTRFYRARLVQ